MGNELMCRAVPDSSGLAFDSLDLLPDAVYVDEVDAQGAVRLAFGSSRYEELSGIPPSELSDDAASWDLRVHPDDLLAYELSFDDLVHGSHEQDIEYRFRRPDGGWVWLRDRARAVLDVERDVTVIHGVLVDVTAQHAALADLEAARAELETAVRKRTADLERALAELRRSEAWFAAAFEAAAVGVVLIDLEGRFARVNPKYCEIVGYTAEELIGTRYTSTTFPADVVLSEESMTRMLSGYRAPPTFAKRYVRKDGAIVWVDVSGSVVRGPGGEPRYFVTMVEDVTERKRAEEAVADSEARYRDLFETLPDAVFLMTDMYLDCNEQACRMLGRIKEELLGRGPAEFAPPLQPDGRDSAAVAQAACAAALAGEPQELPYRHLSSDGEPVDTWITLRAVTVGGCKLLRAIMRDVSEQRRTEAALDRSERLFSGLVANSVDGVMIVDSDGSVLELNAAMERLCGLRREDIVGRQCLDVMAKLKWPPENRAPGWEAIRKEAMAALEDIGSPIFGTTHESSYLHPSGQIRHVERTLFPIPLGDRHLIGALVRDVTKRVEAEKAQRESAARVVRTLERTVAAVSTTLELRDPYTAGHQRRVTQLACAIAEELGSGTSVVETLRIAAMLHDVGKVVVPAELLSRPGDLSDIEMRMVREHAAAGAEVLSDIEFEGPVAAVVAQHHERLDGSGYPKGLSGAQILPEARILAVADVVEATISHRPYRPGLELADAIAELRAGAGTRYDADVCAACIRLFTEKGFAFTNV